MRELKIPSDRVLPPSLGPQPTPPRQRSTTLTLDRILDLTLIAWIIGMILFAIIIGLFLDESEVIRLNPIVIPLWPFAILMLIGAWGRDGIDWLKGKR